MKQVELLAPAGNYEIFKAALQAGADAVYLGGDKFNARAFADNFSSEEVCKAIRYAHLFGKKVYLTLNTLVKEAEMNLLYDYIKPFYLEGLDGVIIQDIGVFQFLKKNFPEMELHVSTQMTVTGQFGAQMLKEMGAARIVPARELSLEEIIEIKKNTGIELETFVHGALCYCYSGQCLFSSMIGGRSGNRGKCAQPCRLPYRVNKNNPNQAEQFPLSLKDLCTIQILPELVEAGIDSFKIEGRMKRLEYVAGVTAMYRKYLDRYQQNTEKPYVVEQEDFELLQSLYIRSEVQDGYYKRQNGKEMITLDKPGYSGTDESIAERIRAQYLNKSMQLPIIGTLLLRVGEPAFIKVQYQNHIIEHYGEMVSAALNKPMSRADIEKQILKTGSTDFSFDSLEIQMDDCIFMPVKALNELRRSAIALLEAQLVEAPYQSRRVWVELDDVSDSAKINRQSEVNKHKHPVGNSSSVRVHVLVTTKAQIVALSQARNLQRIYIPSDSLFSFGKENNSPIWDILYTFKKQNPTTEIFLTLPYIIRKSSNRYLKELESVLENEIFDGVQVLNLEEVQWLRNIDYSKKIALNHNLYIWNQEAYEFWDDKMNSFCAPLELNTHDLFHLNTEKMEVLCYGRIPMMVTANCVQKTSTGCRLSQTAKKQSIEKSDHTSMLTVTDSLIDRYQKKLPVQVNCRHCYNVIYNSVPLSLHQYLQKIMEKKIMALRLDFTDETDDMMLARIQYFQDKMAQRTGDEASELSDYTTGHYKRGAE